MDRVCPHTRALPRRTTAHIERLSQISVERIPLARGRMGAVETERHCAQLKVPDLCPPCRRAVQLSPRALTCHFVRLSWHFNRGRLPPPPLFPPFPLVVSINQPSKRQPCSGIGQRQTNHPLRVFWKNPTPSGKQSIGRKCGLLV